MVYYFSQNGFANLRQANPLGPDLMPGGPADNGATDTIGGTAAKSPPPPASSLAGLMGTSLTNGTVASKLRDGLDAYLEANDNNAAITWDTQLIFSSAMGGAGFWSHLQNEIVNGAGVILLLDWGTPANPPAPDPNEAEYDLPNEPGKGPNQPLSHAVTMVGYDTTGGLNDVFVNDPGNNLVGGAGLHNWTPGQGDPYAVSIGASELSIVISGATANIYGAVITNAIPEPSTLLIVAIAASTTWACRRRSARRTGMVG